MIKTVVVCCGGNLGDWCEPILAKADFVIGADRGAVFVKHLNIPLDIAVGDFDSCSEEERIAIRQYAKSTEIVDAIDKNDTDSGLALRQACSMAPERVIIIGATGTRVDHTLNNIQLLILADESGVPCEIIDAHNRIQLVSPGRELTIGKSDYKYVSLVPLTEKVEGIQLSGFAYPLIDATFIQGSAIGISNQLVSKSGKIAIESGRALLIESRD